MNAEICSSVLPSASDATQHQKIFKWSAIVLWVINLPLVLLGSGSFGLLIVATVVLFVVSLMAQKGQ